VGVTGFYCLISGDYALCYTANKESNAKTEHCGEQNNGFSIIIHVKTPMFLGESIAPFLIVETDVDPGLKSYQK
jgi:hypothetical protein